MDKKNPNFEGWNRLRQINVEDIYSAWEMLREVNTEVPQQIIDFMAEQAMKSAMGKAARTEHLKPGELLKIYKNNNG